MNAMQRVAWFELGVTAAAALLVAGLIPWFGDGATGGFGLLGLLGVSMFFVRRRGDEVVVDERDREIDLRARFLGFVAAWQLTFLTLIALVFWSSQANDGVVPTSYLTWLVWCQFLVCYAVKGLVGVLAYRGQSRAA